LPNIFLAIEYSAMATRNRSRRGARTNLAAWLVNRSAQYIKFANSNRADGYLGWGDSTR